MKAVNHREIPYNFTSADDRLIINHLFGPALWEDLEELRSQRVTGRSARLVMRCMGDLFILHRNPFLYQELIDSPRRQDRGALGHGHRQPDRKSVVVGKECRSRWSAYH